ncbi:MAG: TonB-dependent receptor [Fibrobacteres bacterium]|nr:TonB-dependent receptor [Fibrobacterota bacterium]
MIFRIFLFTSLSLPFCARYAEASKRLQGTVVSADTRMPIPGANIQASGLAAATCDEHGRFLLEVPDSVVSAEITAVDFLGRRVEFSQDLPLIALTPSLLELPSRVVSHGRKMENRAEVPVAISTIGRREMEEVKPNSLDQILNRTSGVLMVDLGNEQHKMAIRQPMTTRSLFLYLEDGIPIRPTGVFNHNALIEINMAGLEKVEVIRGPSSALYGSEAIGGAVNFITRKPSRSPIGKISVQANDIGYRRTDVSGSNTMGKTGVAFGGYFGERTDGPRAHNDFDKLGLNAGVDYTVSEKTRITASAAFVDYKSDMTGGLDSANFSNGDLSSLHTFTWRKVDALRGKLSFDHDGNAGRRTQGAVFYRGGTVGQNPSYRVRNAAGNPALAHGNINDNSVESIGLWGQHEEKASFLNTVLTGGVYGDYSLNEVRERYIRIDRDPATGVYSGYTDTDSMLTDYRVDLTDAAGYAQAKLSPARSLNLVGALRYDHFRYDYSNILDRNAFSGAPDQERSFSEFTPKAGATYDFGANRGGYVNYSRGFSPPQVGELYRGVKVPGLGASYFDNYEVGAWYSLSRRMTAELNAFYIQGRGELVGVLMPDGTTENRNSGQTGHRGVEWGVKLLPIRDLAFRFNGAYAEHEFHRFVEGGNDYGGKEMNEAPNWFWNSGFTLKPGMLKGARLGLEWQRVGEYWMDPANTRSYPGYDLFHLRLGYAWKGIEAWLNVLNLADARYATSSSYAPGTGPRPGAYSYTVGEARSVNLGLAYNLDWVSLKGGR